MRMIKNALALGSILALAGGCSAAAVNSGVGAIAAAPQITKIIYSIGPCHGTCPVYSVTSDSTGAVTFEGERFTKALGRSAIDAPSLFPKLRERLAPLRSAKERSISATNCVLYATDHQTVTIRWQDSSGAVDIFSFDLGCHDAKYAPVRSLIARARRDMPVDGLIGRPTDY